MNTRNGFVLLFCSALFVVKLCSVTTVLRAEEQSENPAMVRSSALLDDMSQQLNRSFQALKNKGKFPLYYLAYDVEELEGLLLSATEGALEVQRQKHTRALTVDCRVGSRELDSTHQIRASAGSDTSTVVSSKMPIDNTSEAVQMVLWHSTDQAFKQAQQRMSTILANKQVTVAEEDRAPDFSDDPPVIAIEPLPPAMESLLHIQEKVRQWSRILAQSPIVLQSRVSVVFRRKLHYFCSSEGAKVRHGDRLLKIRFYASTRADDGMQMFLYDAIVGESPEDLPDDEQMQTRLSAMVEKLKKLRNAPPAEPYVGPAILMNKATGVFFHEVLGHRLEGSELKSDLSGHTFKKKIGEIITSPLITLIDDPGLQRFAGRRLQGYYRYDNEGMRGQRVTLIENGILKNFLMSRTPIEGFLHSNGHGRREPGYPLASRQGNLIVQAQPKVTFSKLKELLIEECKRQGTEYGLIFEDISGGFTNTRRSRSPQAFSVLPLVVYRYYVADRRMELIRGVDIIGTPLQALRKIIAAADDDAVFNGTCGAGSGYVPVSAIAPSILIKEIEVQKRARQFRKLPLLPPPGGEARSAGGGS